MHWTGWIVAGLAVFLGGWLAFDGAHALLTGDYVTPKSGRFARQLGPWSKLVAAVGIDPRSTLMKSIHVGLGALWIAVTLAYAFGASWAWGAMLGCALASLWYLPFGAVIGLVQIVLLLLPPLRSAGAS